jgi:cytosine/creatinine deaminase
VDMHTHLDKGHIWGRSPNLEGTFENALVTVQNDSRKNWNAEDVYRRMEFGLKCSYAHGTQAIRTHIDSADGQAAISLGVFQKLKKEWAERLTLQAVSLVPVDYFLTSDGEKVADLFAEAEGVLGGVIWMNDDVNIQLDRVFELAKERHLDLDFHTDESGNSEDITLRLVAEAALRHEFAGQVVCGHCCSLAVQTPDEAMKTIALVRQSNIGIVSLPMCNLYLQDRRSAGTPRWRGVTLLHELNQHGVPVAVASDNCRDPFYGFGDHDVHEVFTQAVRIAHLDAPYGNWCRTVTATPADLMGITAGRIGVGLPADLILFKARKYSELLSRSQHDRIVLRMGSPIDTSLPDYAELDD